MNLYSYLLPLASGMGITLSLMVFALIAGGCLALVMTLCLLSTHTYLKLPVEILIFFIRGTPLLVQFFLTYYGLGQFEWLHSSLLWVILREPFACAVIALALNTAAYTAVLLKGAILSVPKAEIVACEALGMPYALMLRRVVIPRAIRGALPAYSNEVIMILKGTSLASTITLLDLMGVTNQIIADTYQTFPLLCLSGAIYLTINAVIMRIFNCLEKKANYYLKVV